LILSAPVIAVTFLAELLPLRRFHGHRRFSGVFGCIVALAGTYSLRAHWGAEPRPFLVEWAFPVFVASVVGWFLLYIIDLRSSRIGGLGD